MIPFDSKNAREMPKKKLGERVNLACVSQQIPVAYIPGPPMASSVKPGQFTHFIVLKDRLPRPIKPHTCL